jgi:diguanylate cyclase (GGDEF)-like protein/PAS domain S-box-containing protein
MPHSAAGSAPNEPALSPAPPALSEHSLKSALQTSDVYVWEYDVVSGAVAFSRELGTMLGYAHDAVPDRIEAWEALVHPEDVVRSRAEMARHFRGETAVLDVESRVRAKDGAWVWLHTVGGVIARDAGGRAVRISGTHRDVTALRLTGERLRLRELAIEAATNAIILVDAQAPDRPIVHVNSAFEVMTGYPAEEVIGHNCRFLQGDDREQPEVIRLRRAIAEGAHASVVLRNYHKDGTLFWNSLRVSPVRDEAGVVTHFVGIQTDVTELKTYQQELERRANYDELTGLANKNLLSDRVDHACAVAQRSRRRFGLLYLDLDRFKLVNESLGHQNGDTLLKHVASRLKDAVRDADTVARMGGDEFAILLHELDDPAAVASVAQKILKVIEAPLEIASQQVFCSGSVGICIGVDDGADAQTLLRDADSAMYRAKASGRNQMCFYTEDLNAHALERLRLDADLRAALAANAFELHYQPRVNLATGAITSVEALIRWRHAEHGLVSPASFIPLAEETGLIVPIGEWVLRTACAQMREWRDAGLRDMRVAVNLSPRQFRQPDLISMVAGVLEEEALEATHLELEITEGVAMHDPVNNQKVLEELSARGIALAIDDFGTGYSSLAYLKRFPIDYLKIDQSFVRGVPGDEDDENIVRSIIGLARNLKLAVIAEGVETEAQREFLRLHDCDEMQGYLFSRPKPAEELGGLLFA